MSFKVFGIDFNITVPFTIMLAFLLIIDKTGLMTASIFAVLTHEIGHLIAMRYFKCLPKMVSLRLGGIIICGSSYCTFGENAIISFSGPLLNFVSFSVFYPIGFFTRNNYLLNFSVVQLVEGAMNMVPINGLDGGSLLHIFLEVLNIRHKNLVFNVISFSSSILIFIIGTAIAVRNVSNPSLLLLGIYLIILNIIKN